MSQSWRISTIENNLNSTAIPTVGNVGASVIRASKGPVKPVKIYKGQEQRLLSIFGKPSSSYPDIWDAVEFCKKADLWISAPSKNGLYGGVLVTKTGTVPLTSGLSSISTVPFTALPVEETLGTGDGSTVTFSATLTDKTYYNNTTIDIEVDGVSINVTATDVSTEVLSTTPNVGSGTYVRTTGVLTFTFSSAPISGQAITVTYTTNRANDVYYALFSAYPYADDLAVKITEASSVFTITAYQKDSNGNYIDLPDSPYYASLTANTKDGFGKNIYIIDTFTDDDYITPVINTALTFTTFTDDTSIVDFDGGSRGATITITELTTGWNYFQFPTKYAADIFFDCTADSGVPALFSTLRGTYQKYSAYLLPLPNTNSATAISNKSALSVSNRGIYFYWNWGKVQDYYNNSYFYSALMGRVAGKHADMVDVFNGLAPSWIDENNHGGQLGSGILELVNDPTESELEALDTAQINPIIFDPNYGVMIVSDRTSLSTLSDYSYIGHSRTADFIISNVVAQALPFQLTKLNDLNHRGQVRSKAELIVNPLLRAPYSLLRDARVVCDETNNGDEVLAKREFHLDLYVQFSPFSETIRFVFTNIGQNTTIDEVLGS
jgi:hypothetical protein